MSRRFASISLLTAWLCASGAMLDVAQVVAWTRMFAGYARTESIAAAARETFDPGKPCAMCRAVGRARDACGDRHAPVVLASGVEKMVLILERASPIVAPLERSAWPETARPFAPLRVADVPVPPPKADLA